MKLSFCKKSARQYLAASVCILTGSVALVAAEKLPERPTNLPPVAPPPTPESHQSPHLFRTGENILSLPEPTTTAPRFAKPTAAVGPDLPSPPTGTIGVVRIVSKEANAASLAAKPRKTQLPDGRTLWTLAVQSKGAKALRLHLSQVSLGNGTLVIYGMDGTKPMARGPYQGKGPRGRGDFWTATVPGSLAFLECIGEDQPRFDVVEIGHIDALNLDGPPEGTDQDCHINARCQEDLPDLARDATGFMNFIDGGRVKLCTGTLLADEDPETHVPYFLSAYHCISSQDVADTLEVVWLWQASCGGFAANFMELPRSEGATLLETSATKGGNDMSFFRLEGSIPPGVSLAGWSAAEPPKDNDSPRFASHHPAGDWLRGGRFHRIDPFLVCKDLVEYYAFRCDTGVIEGGSSGSGIFNGAGQLQGQLYGRCCPSWLNGDENCEEADCSNRGSWSALYGRFDRTWGKVGKWLAGIGGTIHVDASNGSSGNGTKTNPFKRLSDAYALSWPGSRILMRPGNYSEKLVLSKPTPVESEGISALIGLGSP